MDTLFDIKTYLIKLCVLLSLLTIGCQSSPINQTVYAATPDSVDLYFGPTMQQELPTGRNAVYAASLPLAWQAVRKELNLLDGVHTKSADLRMLDVSETVESTLDEDDYERDITRRGQFLHVKTKQEVNLSFIPSFEDFPQGLPFDDIIVNAFGTRGFQNPAYINQLHIAAYRDDNRFILRLTPPQQEHELFLFKADSAYSTFQQMYSDLVAACRHEGNDWRHQLTDLDEVVIPKVNFDQHHQFQQLLKAEFFVRQQKYTIADATQQIAFELNEHGVSMKTEAEIIVNDGAFPPAHTPVPKRLIFDKPFYIVMKKADMESPYFALYIANATLLEKENI